MTLKSKILAMGLLIAATAFGAPAEAGVITLNFGGLGFSGSAALTLAPNVAPADPNPNCGTAGNNPCRTDPASAYAITGISGTFSNAANGISNAQITGLVPINPANERDAVFDPFVPSSLSFIDYAAGAALTYDNLFYPTGSPIVCDFPFTGTYLDVFGMAFTVEGGYIVDLWGDGDLHGPGTTTYGIRVVQGANELANQFDGLNAAVPEANTFAMFAAGLLGLAFLPMLRKRSLAV
ncbi:MAG: hypothetical protein J0H30_10600 [Alphaproteobacteria bacterium]|nr:hypothetical protein [Alphaproteobacteria bacterium]MBN9577150.1 hypothetical protein [Alphaproteobacteria bacterium]